MEPDSQHFGRRLILADFCLEIAARRSYFTENSRISQSNAGNLICLQKPVVPCSLSLLSPDVVELSLKGALEWPMPSTYPSVLKVDSQEGKDRCFW